MYPGNCNAHKWFAICSGARGQLGTTKEKIEGGYIFQNHINEAIKINSRDPTLYYLKGKLEYEVKFIEFIESVYRLTKIYNIYLGCCIVIF